MINSNKKYKHFLNTEAQKLRSAGKAKENPSRYFGEIGSIPLEDLKYSDQLTLKLDVIKSIFSDILNQRQIKEYEIVGSPKEYEYRFRLDYVCTFNPIHEPNNRLGQRKAGKFNWVVDMDESILFPNDWFAKVRKIYLHALDLEIPLYDLVKHTGELRYFVVRQHNNKAMLSIVTTNVNNPKLDSILELAENLGFASIQLIHQPTVSDSVEGETVKTVGSDSIKVKMGERKFLVGNNTFFQNNILAFELIIDFVNESIQKNGTLIDLYSGIGTLGLIFANKFNQVLSYELVDENVKYAKLNAELNKISNFNIIQKNLNDSEEINSKHKNQTLIVDPPRTGLEKNGIKHVLSFNPKQIIYISCNPVTQADDVRALITNGYQVVKARAFDLFPHTLHVENVVVLEK